MFWVREDWTGSADLVHIALPCTASEMGSGLSPHAPGAPKDRPKPLTPTYIHGVYLGLCAQNPSLAPQGELGLLCYSSI